MKKLFLSLITFIAVAAFAQEKTVIADANAQKRTLNASFTGISVSDGVDLYLTQDNEESVAVSAAEEKYMERFKTVVEDGILKIYFDNKGINWAVNDKRKLKAYVSFKTLEKLHASGGADVKIQGSLDVTNLEVKFTSGSSFSGKLKASELTVEQNSGSSINISGSAEKIKVDVSSGAIFKSYDLSVNYCDAKASSGGGVRITINKELSAKANSGGGVKYKGDAVIKDINVNSGGSVKKA
ncbi:head GIN domain-containing protein [Ferruginibacter sp. SUN106]|uniref:head GIN domain-containing protein n=1 Tax=Ferruginibacter sp. SUN106 TaxID=2978348 RepID=UPI003D35BE41